MKSGRIEIIKYILLLLSGAFLLYLAFRNQNFREISAELQKTKTSTFVLVFSITFIGNIIRTLRWRLLLASAGHIPSAINTFLSLMFGYFVNFGVPRLGEITRCYSLTRSENIPFNLSIGTVITERAIDILCLLLLCLITFLLQYDLLSEFFLTNMVAPIVSLLQSKVNALFFLTIMMVLLGIAAILFLYIFRKKLLKFPLVLKIQEFAGSVLKGILSVFQLKRKKLFFLYTAGIWVCYFLSTFLWFGGYDKTEHLGLNAGLTLLVVGSLGRSIPIQGHGMGAYHFLISTALTFYGISTFYGNILATVIYLTQTAFYLGVGAVCTIIIFLMQRNIISRKERIVGTV